MNNEPNSPDSGTPGPAGLPSSAPAPAAKSRAPGRPVPRRNPRRRRFPILPVAIVLVLVVLGLGAVSAKPAWRMVKRYRAERFLAEGARFAADEKWAEAFARARSAQQLAPSHAPAVRFLAGLFSRLGLEQGLVQYERLLALPGATRQDREDFASLALRVGNPELANTQLEELLEQPNPPARTLILGAQLAGARRDVTNAVRLAREAYQKEQGNPTNAFVLASLLINSRTFGDRSEGRAVLWPIARAAGPVQAQALGAILEGAEAPRSDREEVEAILKAKANRTMVEELILAAARVSLEPETVGKRAEEIVEKYGRGTTEQTAAAASWLNRHQLFAQTRDLILPEPALQDSRLFNLRFAALMGLKDLRGAYDFIKADKTPGDPLQVEMLRCSTALQLNDQALVDLHFHALLELGKRSGRTLRAVAEYASRNGQRATAVEAYKLLLRSPRDSGAALRGLMRVADGEGKTWEAREHARLYSKARKDDDAAKLQVAYYDLLLKENIDEALAVTTRLHQQKPEDFNRRAVLALAHLRNKQPKDAYSLLEGQIVSWARVPAGVRAIAAATFEANGQRKAASNLLLRLPLKSLKPEERELIRPIVGAAAFKALDAEVPVESAEPPAGTVPKK